jgi:TfoX/Sxy family transcriptional regulator of competence genes
MAYDEKLAGRIRAGLSHLAGLQEKKMFGGVGFLVHGNMACGVHGGDLIVRVGPGKYQGVLQRPFTRPFDMTGKPMTGWITVEPKGCQADGDLTDWIGQGVDFAQSLPAK